MTGFLLAALASAVFAQTDIEAALNDYDSGNYTEAAPAMQSLARAGNAVAQYKLSIMHFYGHGVAEDESEAMVWAQRAAAQGEVDAMFFIGTMYVFGDTVHQTVDDPDVEAAKWFFQAASRGHADAEYSLGLLFLAGKGVTQSQEEALKWIGRAAEHGHASARDFLAGHRGGH
ncbi:tetratricopeptide repeat protein [Nitrogeniibacter aestuarii]|uniref:tetratricopeptide repeat protein n=1 Tax=Nitrogeniibacter aestuarii TaxID=2815343 RepID=UPI001E30BC1B|nr:tetratricopeptide repeat protein [Nitrogeniibacter aestuarii]